MMTGLTELRSRCLADGVEKSLLSYIRRSGLTPGNLLPKEEELARQLNVSRHVVREGVSRLKTLGLIESRKRKGMILTRPNAFAGVSKLAAAKMFSDEECYEFTQIRVFMELGMAETIFRKKTPETLQELRTLAGEHGRHPTLEEEIAFHHKLVSIGGNGMGEEFMKILMSSFTYLFQKDISSIVTPFHPDICDALEGDSAADFRNVMKAHFEPYLNNL